MRSYLDCLPCFLNQALKAARAATDDENLHRRVLNAVAGMIPELSLGVKPPEIARQCYKLVYETVGNSDPFREAKAEATRVALECYPRLKEAVAGSADPLLTACKLAIAGNAIDLGPDQHYGSIENIMETALELPLVINHYEQLVANIEKSRNMVYLGDNAGETVFDRVLIEQLLQTRNLKISYVVRGEPIINDATLPDALAAGIDGVAEIISNGSDAPATILSRCSPPMLERYHAADFIIAKGQGNYESLNEETENIFFFLKVKCRLVATAMQVNVGDAILKHNLTEI